MFVALFAAGARGFSPSKGLYALGILSHEASIIAAKERAEMKTIEFFIPRKLSLTVFIRQSSAAGVTVQRSRPCVRASGSRCQRHRKRRSQHRVNGCGASRSRLHYLACRTRADRM